jgi:hypothetical protein
MGARGDKLNPAWPKLDEETQPEAILLSIEPYSAPGRWSDRQNPRQGDR